MKQRSRKNLQAKIRYMAGVAILSAIVVVLQLLGSFIRLGPVSICLVLVPIVVGAAAYGPGAGGILGAVFSIVVLCQPDTSFFYGISVPGTVLTVLTKGILGGWLSGLAYRTLCAKNAYLASVVAAIICPIVNTGIFFLGCLLFFWDGIAEAFGGDVMHVIITVMIGINFLAEFAVNIIISPSIPSILRASRNA
ncbi:MAG: ECF transporter S component [Ruminococcaceae bacterium]|nr:ECF transporter S component [Oscillospiraceae bacterium]